MPRPNSSTPQLLLTVTRSVAPAASTASINVDGQSAESETTDGQRRPAGDVGDGVGGAGDYLVHLTAFSTHQDDGVAKLRTASRDLRRRTQRDQSCHHLVNDHRIAFSHKDIDGPVARGQKDVLHLHRRHDDERVDRHVTCVPTAHARCTTVPGMGLRTSLADATAPRARALTSSSRAATSRHRRRPTLATFSIRYQARRGRRRSR